MRYTRTMSDNWRILADQAWYWKGHFVPAALLADLEADLNQRAAEMGPHTDGPEKPIFQINTPGPEDGIFIDLPGMVSTKRRIREVVVHGLRVAVPSQDWTTILSEAKLAKERVFASGAKYYKLHARFWALVLTPEQRRDLIAGMEAQLPDAEREGEEDNQALAGALKDLPGVKCARADAVNAANEGKKKNDAN